MIKSWRIELNKFISLILLGAFGGWVAGYPGWGVALLLIPYTFWHLRRLRELLQWMEDGAKIDDAGQIPESTGAWGQLFDHMNQRFKETHARLNRLKQSIERTQQSSNAIKDAIVLFDNHGGIEWWNESATHLLGFRKTTDRHQVITNLVRDPRFVRFFEGGIYDNSVEIPSPANPEIFVQIHISKFGKNERLLVARDVTRLHSLEQVRKDFVANVSHELRTPLTVIKGYLDTFLGVLDPEENRALHRGLTQMEQQTHRMELLVADLLLLSKLETESIKSIAKPINVARLLKQIQADAKALNEEKQHAIELSADENLLLLGDENELRSAFSNLIINAVKYTPPQGTINIRWWHTPEGGHFCVQDNGIGIEARHIPRLTERFYRADQSRHSETGGTGLGLAIVKHVLIHHSAQLEIKSQLGRGSEFICHFPTRQIILQNQSIAS